jgi:hypothetical protein
VTIEILYFAGCLNHEQLVKRLPTLLRIARIATEPSLCEITTQDDGEQQRFLGSPTLRVNGHDVEPGAEDRTDYGMKCRVYRTPEGLISLPTDRWTSSPARWPSPG